MIEIISAQHLERLCADRDYDGLTWISGVLCGSKQFRSADPTYGLPGNAFCLVERLIWFAQGVRSGAWTYFEATPPDRQAAMLAMLRKDEDHPDFTECYGVGMREWQLPLRLAAMDRWLDEHDERNNRIAWQTVWENRELLQDIANTT